jgi:hypothetical protein
MPWSSVDHIATFAVADLIAPRPLLMIVGRKAVTSWISIEAFQKARGDKHLVWIEGASHVDLYDKPQYVDAAIKTLTGFFNNKLSIYSRSSATTAAPGGE